MTPQELAERALAASTSPDCVCIVTDTHSANVRWANNTLTTNGVGSQVHATVIALDGARSASVSATVSDAEQVAELARAADAACGDAEAGEDARELVDGGDPTTWDEPPSPTGIEVFADFAGGLGEAFAQAEAGGRILYGFASHEVATTYLASTRGLRLRHEQPTGHYACTGKPDDLSASAWAGGATRDFRDVDARALADTVAGRLSWAARKVDLPPGRYDTILPPTAVADLMIEAYWNAGARVAHDGQTVYSRPSGGTRLGERIASPGVSMWSDPAHPELACEPFVVAPASSEMSSVYDNGLDLSRTDWIDNGVLSALIQTRHSADLTGGPVTPGIDNLVLDAGGTGTEEDLVAGMEDGLLLTCLWYIREVDPQTLLLTGLTRDGVYRVERGEITGVVNNFRFNESPIDLLNRFSVASATVPSFSREWGEDYFSRTATPALRVPDFNMSSVSQAL